MDFQEKDIQKNAMDMLIDFYLKPYHSHLQLPSVFIGNRDNL